MSNAISQVMHQRMADDLGIPRKEHYDKAYKAVRKRLRGEIEADRSWQKKCREADPPRPTKKVPVPLPKWVHVTQRERLSEGPTRRALRKNKLVDFEFCEYTGHGPVDDLEFCHTLDFAVCMKHYHMPEWAADNNNGFILLGCLNPPMKRGFHWTVDGVYVPPEGEDYPDWMKVLSIPNFRVEPTPAQLKYIILAMEHRTGIVF